MASKPTRNAGPRYIVLGYGATSYVVDRIGRGASDLHSQAGAEELRGWLNDRDAGYPSLRRFEGADESRYDAVPKWELPKYMRDAKESEYRSDAQ